MTELKSWTLRRDTAEEPVQYSIHFDRFPSLRQTRITSTRHASAVETLSLNDNVVVRVAIALLSEGAPKVDPDTIHVEHSTKLKWESFNSYQMGCGMVGYKQSTAEKHSGVYDPHTVLIHEHAENTDSDVMRVVENECAMLVYLLDKFRFDNDFISDHAKSCGIDFITESVEEPEEDDDGKN